MIASTVRENVSANLRVILNCILRKCGYAPDLQKKATQTVLEQAEALSGGWAAVWWLGSCRRVWWGQLSGGWA